MERLFPCLCLLLFTQTAFPCINRSGTKFNGEPGGSPYRGGVYELKQALASNPAQDGATMETDLRGATEFEKRSDYSAALMYLGRSKEAVALLEQLEKEKPGQYFIAANLGTAYEL